VGEEVAVIACTLRSLLFCLGCSPGAEPPAARPSGAAYSEANALLDGRRVVVRGEVVRVNPPIAGSSAVADVRVTHVYTGPADLKDTTFRDYTADSTLSDRIAAPLLKVKEEGIWQLGTDLNTGDRFVLSRSRKGRFWYEERVKWAEAVEKLTKLAPAPRLRVAKEMCFDQTKYVAVFAVQVVATYLADDADRDKVAEFLTGLTSDPKAPVPALLEVDRQLMARTPESWVGAAARQALFKRLVSLTRQEDVDAFTSFLHRQSQSVVSGVPPTKAVAYVGRMLEVPDRPVKTRVSLAQTLVELAGLHRPMGECFDLLACLVKDDPAPEVRRWAAPGLDILADRPRNEVQDQTKISPQQLAVLEGLLAAEKDKDIAALLRTAVEKARK
jgi:hypothetical protein